MATIEDTGGDARSGDGYVILFKIVEPHMTGVLAVPAKSPPARSLSRLARAINRHDRLSVQLEGFEVTSRQTGKTGVCEIKFAVRAGMEQVIQEFLEYAKQARVLTNPIISDLREFNPGQ